MTDSEHRQEEDFQDYDQQLADENTKNVKEDAKKINVESKLGKPKFAEFMEKALDVTHDALKVHMDSYSKVLQEYAEDLTHSLSYKRQTKIRLFNLCIFIMIAILIVLCFSIFSGIDSFEKCIAAVVPFLTIFIIIPKTITEYLFNSKEGEALATILDAIRQHDEKTLQLMIEGDKGKNGGDKA